MPSGGDEPAHLACAPAVLSKPLHEPRQRSGGRMGRVAGVARSTSPPHLARLAGPESGQVYEIGLRSRFRGVTVRQGLVWRGPAGWAEWSPFLDYAPREAGTWLRDRKSVV